jgi:hypothetical protein
VKTTVIMKNNTAVVYVGLLVACLTAFVGVSSAVKCYECNSGTTPTCSENFFVSYGIEQEDGCACCIKQVSSSATVRECAGPTSSYKCLNPSSGNYVCTSDLCNTANHDGSRITMATLMTSLMIGAMIVRFF